MPGLRNTAEGERPPSRSSRHSSIAPDVMKQRHMQELMALSPEVTGDAILAMASGVRLEDFQKYAMRKGLRLVATSLTVTLGDLTNSADTLQCVLRWASCQSVTVAARCRRVSKAAVVCQRFVRRALLRRWRQRALLLMRWDVMLSRARRALEVVVKETVRRRFNAGRGFQEAVWGLLMDCYAAPEEMRAAIDMYYADVRRHYLHTLRQHRADALRALVQAAKDSLRHAPPPSLVEASRAFHSRRRQTEAQTPTTTKGIRAALAAQMAQFPLMSQWSAAPASVAELCVYLAYIQAADTQRRLAAALRDRGASAALSRRGSAADVSSPPPPARPQMTQSGVEVGGQPVSYLHALLTLNPRTDFSLLLALRLVSSGPASASARDARQPWAPPMEEMARARAIVSHWRGPAAGATAPTTAEPPAAGRRSSKARASGGPPLTPFPHGARRPRSISTTFVEPSAEAPLSPSVAAATALANGASAGCGKRPSLTAAQTPTVVKRIASAPLLAPLAQRRDSRSLRQPPTPHFLSPQNK